MVPLDHRSMVCTPPRASDYALEAESGIKQITVVSLALG